MAPELPNGCQYGTDLFKRPDSYASDCQKDQQHIYIRMDYILPFQSQELFQDIRLLQSSDM